MPRASIVDLIFTDFLEEKLKLNWKNHFHSESKKEKKKKTGVRTQIIYFILLYYFITELTHAGAGVKYRVII